MIRSRLVLPAVLITATLLWFGWAASGGAQSAAQATSQVTAEQQKQLDQLKQMETQLQNDRAKIHDAIAKYGWDSDQVDAAQDQLWQDRIEYRKLRRSLIQAGVAVPPPAGFGAGGGMGPGRGMRGGGRGYQHCPGCADCPCCGM